MNKTKHLKKRNRLFKKTRKYIGGNSNKEIISENNNIPQSEGIFDIIGDKISDFAKGTTNYVKDKALRLVGLQPIPTIQQQTEQQNINQSTQQLNKTIDGLNNKATGILSDAETTAKGVLSNVSSIGNDAVNVVNKGAAAVIGNINDVLDSPQVETSVSEAAKQTAEVGTKLLQKFNANLNNPQFKENTKEALDNFSDYAEISVKALNEPLDSAIDELNQAGTKAAAGVASGIVKVGTDAMGAIPGVGAIIDVGKMINDGTKAASTVVEAGTEAAETVSDLFMQTNEGIKKGIKELEEKKNEAANIVSRTSDSINQFQNPLTENTNKVGGSAKKSKKRLFKHKTKTKRVHFLL